MAETTQIVKKAASSPKKVVKKSNTSAHPSYLDMVVAAVQAMKERRGSSRQAILKYILANYNVGTDPKAVNSHLRQALKRAVIAGAIKNTKVNSPFFFFSHFIIFHWNFKFKKKINFSIFLFKKKLILNFWFFSLIFFFYWIKI